MTISHEIAVEGEPIVPESETPLTLTKYGYILGGYTLTLSDTNLENDVSKNQESMKEYCSTNLLLTALR